MNQRRPPDLDMTPRHQSHPDAGSFISLVAGAISLAAFALWVAPIILPIALGAAVVAWVMFRYRVWRMQRAVNAQRNIWRP